MGGPFRGSLAPLTALALVAGMASAQSAAKTSVPIPLPPGITLAVPVPKSASPDVIVLTPEKFRELNEQIQKLQAQLQSPKAVRPRSCELEGRLEQRGDQWVVKLKAHFQVTTTQPWTVVLLGCQRAKATEAKADDGKAPLLTTGEDGLRLHVETPGNHSLRLDLDVPVGPRGTKGDELGFDVGLPGAPITILTFEPPPNVKRLSVATRSPKPTILPVADLDVEQVDVDRFLPAQRGAQRGAPLGPVTYLALAWPDAARQRAPVRTAQGEVMVSVGAEDISTEVRFRLRGSASEWRFTAPASADVTVAPWPTPGTKGPTEPTLDRPPSIVRPEPSQSVWKVQFPEARTVDLLVVATTRTVRPRPDDPASKNPVAIGPFVVLDVPQQSGVARVRAPLNWRVNVVPKGSTRREADEATGDVAYRYAYGPLTAAPAEPIAELTLVPAVGEVNVRTRHDLRLGEAGWRLSAEIAVSPSRTEVEALDIEIPPGFQPSAAEPKEIVDGFTTVEGKGGRPVARVRLLSPKRASFAFTLEGSYAIPPGRGTATLLLPRVLRATERSTEIVATAPNRFDLRGTFRAWEGDKPGDWEYPLELEASDRDSRVRGALDRPAAAVAVAWRPAEQAVTVQSVADVDLDGARTVITQRLRYQFAGRPPARLRLQGDPRITAVRAVRGTIESAGDAWELLVAGESGREAEFVLSYVLPAEADGSQSLAVAILNPDSAAVAHTLRVWDPLGRTVELASPSEWVRSRTEVVDGRAALPALVATASGAVAAPALTLGPSTGPATLPVRIERAAIHAKISDVGSIVRVRFWAREWDRDFDLSMPIGATAVDLSLRGKRVPLGQRPDGTRTVRVTRPAVVSVPEVIEVEYRLVGLPHGEIRPPEIVGHPPIVDAVWSLQAPPGGLLLVPGEVDGSWSASSVAATYGTSRLQSAGDLERSSPFGPAVVARPGSLGPIRTYVVPRDAWLAGWTAAAYLTAMLLGFTTSRRRRVIAALLVAAGVAGFLLVPQPAAVAVLAAAPGLVAYGLTVLVFRWIRVRYQRKLDNVPGFSRGGSSLIRPSATRAASGRASDSAIPEAVPVIGSSS